MLDALDLRYVVGGSIASSLHGVPRSTNDIDLVVVLAGKHVDDLVARLASSFYVDKDMIVDAVRRHSSFNIIHLATMYKVDLFVADRSELCEQEFARGEAVRLGDPPRDVWICSAEDIVLQKLDWFKKGNEISERKWTDLMGVLKVQGSRLDLDYLRRWAAALGVSELLTRALRESALA
ncbi:MAG TPA: hypothetical protein VGP93_21220 [Polyangiaceae bacterium]|nr:hypothetical protein [Polyangiaceae bacterium]